MAFANVNTNFGTSVITRGKVTSLGTIAAAQNYVQFTLPGGKDTPNGFDTLVLVTTGNLSASSPILEGSLDGTNWFAITIPTSGSTVPILGTTLLTGETAVTSANAYSIVQGIVYRYGFNTFTSGSGTVFAFIA